MPLFPTRHITAGTSQGQTYNQNQNTAMAGLPPAQQAQQQQQGQQQDELTMTVFGAVEGLSQSRKAGFLLETSLALIENGRYVLVHLAPPPCPLQPCSYDAPKSSGGGGGGKAA